MLNLKEIRLQFDLWVDCEFQLLPVMYILPLPMSHVYFSEKLRDIQQAKCYSKWEAWSSVLLVTCQRDSMLRWLTQSKEFLKYTLNLFLKLSIWKKMIFFLKGFFYYYLNKITLCTSIKLCTKIKGFFSFPFFSSFFFFFFLAGGKSFSCSHLLDLGVKLYFIVPLFPGYG